LGRGLRHVLVYCAALVSGLAVAGEPAGQPALRIAVLDFESNATATRAATKLRELFRGPAGSGFVVIDSDQARTAARAAGYEGSLNLTVAEARDLGAAMGTDFYFLSNADTVRRSPSTGPSYYEAYASIFIVSARSGRLIFWERPLERRDTAADAENALLQVMSPANKRQQYATAIASAAAAERSERSEAVDSPAPVIVDMIEEGSDAAKDLRAPRPYRRLKPPYPQSAAVAEVEAVVDVLADIDAHGEVGKLQIARWAGYGLDQAVLDTVRQMHFFPALRDNVPVPMRVLLRYNFRKPPQ